MTKRIDPSALKNKWHDAQRVEQQDMQVEQAAQDQVHAATIQNHFGSGVILNAPEQPVLFDSDNLTAAQAAIEAAGDFDGTGMSAHAQPSDPTQGNQLEVELTDSSVFGRLCTKVAIIGLAFDDTLQIDRFYFYKNEKQVTSKHYKEILSIITNGFKGNNNCSRNNGGQLVVREAKAFQLSRDPIMVAQDLSPDIFWRDFRTTNTAILLDTMLQTAIGSEYDIASLNVDIGGRADREILIGDVTTQYGQKFQATTGNIQKITLLVGVSRDDTVPILNKYDWSGDIVINVYELQNSTDITCPSAIVPALQIDFDPDMAPLAQLSFSQSELYDNGFVLTEILQPVDFIFRGTKLDSDSTSGIVVGNYYAVTIKRAGTTTVGSILVGTGENVLDNSRETIFSGVWVDVQEEDLWFQVWTDAAKIASGMGYDNGTGMQYDKVTVDSSTGADIDYQVGHMVFEDTGENVLNIGILEAVEQESKDTQDERTGSPITSRQEFVPEFSFISQSTLTTLKDTSEPVVIGCMKDINAKLNDELTKTQDVIGLATGDNFCIINPDADLLSLNLIGSKLTPNNANVGVAYRIFKTTLCIDGYGDVLATGSVDGASILRATQLLGESLSFATTQQKIVDGYFSVLELLRANVSGSGIVSATDIDLITKYVNKEINSFPVGTSFTHLCLEVSQLSGRWDMAYDCSSDGYVFIGDGYELPDGTPLTELLDPNLLLPIELIYYGYPSPIFIETDPVFTTVPFVAVNYKITPQPYWQPFNIIESSDARLVPVTFSYDTEVVQNACTSPLFYSCTDRGNPTVSVDPGRNDFFVPNNLIIGDGQILRPDGNFYKNDMEIGTVEIQFPEIPIPGLSINVFTGLICDSTGTGYTSKGYPAMRYADCSTVQPGDLALGRVRITASIQSYSPSLDGYEFFSDGYLDGYEVILDNLFGIALDESTGVLTVFVRDLFTDPVNPVLVSKLTLIIFLKKAGFNNNSRVVTPDQLVNLLAP